MTAGRRTALLIGGITLLAALIRRVHLGFKSLWLDEAICFWASQPDFWEVVAVNRSVRATPPLFNWLVHGLSAWDTSEAWLRAPAWLSGVATVPASFWLARRFTGPALACFAAALVAVAPHQLEFSQLVSEYALAGLLATVACAVFVGFLREPGWRLGVPLAVVMLLGVGVHFGFGLLIAALNLALLIELRWVPDRRRLVGAWVLVQLPLLLGGVFGLLHLDLGAALSGGAPGQDGYLLRGYWRGSLQSLGQLVIGNTFRLFGFAFPASGVLLFLCALPVLRAARDPQARTALVMLGALLGVSLLAALLQLYPYRGTRHTFFVLPMIYAVAALGLGVIAREITDVSARRGICTILVVLLLGIGLFESARHLDSELQHMRPVRARLEQERRPGDDVFVTHFASPAFAYYEPDAERRAELRATVAEWLPPVQSPERNESDRERLDSALAGGGRLWMVFAHCHGSSCERLRRIAARGREVTLVTERSDAALYLAVPLEPAPASTNVTAE